MASLNPRVQCLEARSPPPADQQPAGVHSRIITFGDAASAPGIPIEKRDIRLRQLDDNFFGSVIRPQHDPLRCNKAHFISNILYGDGSLQDEGSEQIRHSGIPNCSASALSVVETGNLFWPQSRKNSRSPIVCQRRVSEGT